MLFVNSKAYALSALAAALLIITGCDNVSAQDDSAKETEETKTAVVESSAGAPVNDDSSFEDRASYAFGASIGLYVTNMQKTQGDIIGPLSNELIMQGFTDAMNDKSVLDQATIESILIALNEKAQEAMITKARAEAEANLAAGEKFLEENKGKEGVVVTESGLQYKVITEGSGKKPTLGDTISVKYKGTTIDGTVFDEQTEPVEFPLAGMIQGWVEALQLMSEGSVYELYIPSHLAYGENGAGDFIKPNSMLIFNVELIGVTGSEQDQSEEDGAADKKEDAKDSE